MRKYFLILAAVAAVLNTGAEAMHVHSQVYLYKPLATLLLAVVVLRAADQSRADQSRYHRWMGAGLVAALAGDILLMLPQGLFLPGLTAFLVAHLCFIRAFATDGGGLRAPLLPAVPVAVAAIGMLVYLWPSLGSMRWPVVCYAVAIAAMAWQAIARWSVRRTSHAAWAAVGSVFFLASDSMLASDRFVAPFATAAYVVLGTYYAALWGLTLSVRDVNATA